MPSMLKNYILSFEKVASITFSAILFFGCAAFVIHRGYECFSKYLEEPEAVDISYKFTGQLPFPALTVCTRS